MLRRRPSVRDLWPPSATIHPIENVMVQRWRDWIRRALRALLLRSRRSSSCSCSSSTRWTKISIHRHHRIAQLEHVRRRPQRLGQQRRPLAAELFELGAVHNEESRNQRQVSRHRELAPCGQGAIRRLEDGSFRRRCGRSRRRCARSRSRRRRCDSRRSVASGRCGGRPTSTPPSVGCLPRAY